MKKFAPGLCVLALMFSTETSFADEAIKGIGVLPCGQVVQLHKSERDPRTHAHVNSWILGYVSASTDFKGGEFATRISNVDSKTILEGILARCKLQENITLGEAMRITISTM